MRGGARPGAGRPKAPPVCPVRFNLTPEQHRIYKEMGGSRMAKRVLLELIDAYERKHIE